MLYQEHHYPRLDLCSTPCTVLDIRTSLVSKKRDSKARLEFMLGKDMPVLQQVLEHTFLSLVAELGGYLGITLGLSLLHVEQALQYVYIRVTSARSVHCH